MPIAVKCSDCGKQYRLKDETAGKSFGCKECGTNITVPEVQLLRDDDFQNEDDSWEVEEEGYQPSEKRQTRPGRQKKKKKSSFSIMSVLTGVVLVFVAMGVIGGIVSSIKNDGRRELPYNNELEGFQPEDFQEVVNNQWKQVVITEGNVSALMPNTPASRVKRTALNGTISYQSQEFQIRVNYESFYLCELLFSPQNIEVPEGLGDEARELILGHAVDILYRIDKEYLSKKDVVFKKMHGKEYRVLDDEFISTIRIFARPNGLAILGFTTHSKHPKNELQNKFFNSLNVEAKAGNNLDDF